MNNRAGIGCYDGDDGDGDDSGGDGEGDWNGKRKGERERERDDRRTWEGEAMDALSMEAWDGAGELLCRVAIGGGDG